MRLDVREYRRALTSDAGFRKAPVCDWLREPITDKALAHEFDQIECQVDADYPSIKTGTCRRGKPRPKLFYRRAR